MNRNSRIAIGIAAVCVAAAIGFFVLWLGTGGGTPPIAQSQPEPPVENPLPDSTPGPNSPRSLGASAIAASHLAPPAALTNSGPPDIVGEWEERVEAILSGEEEDIPQKARAMLDLYPHVPEEAKPEVAEHLANLTPDEMYQPLGDMFADTNQPPEIQEIFMHDLLNRPNSVKLPELLRVAQVPNHPKAAEAREVLTLFLEHDYGGDWQRWQVATDEWLKQNPD